MELFEKFGEFDSYEEINLAAANLLKENDLDSIYELAEENGIDKLDAQDFIEGFEQELCSAMMAAIGKIEVEKKYLGLKEAEEDYAELIIHEIHLDPEFALAVRKKGKSLAGALGKILSKAWSIKHDLHPDILEMADIKGRVQSGSPGNRTVMKLMREYYLGGTKK